MDVDVLRDDAATGIGSYFISNYPPYSAWSPDHVPAAMTVLNAAPPTSVAVPLGLYIHIPFCRRRCDFCYFKVYTDKNARDVDVYIDALVAEAALLAGRAAFANRSLDFVYFGGGTPSFLSSQQLQQLVDGIAEHWTWDRAREVTFECEPGTLKKSKLETIKAIGTTRLSLGVEHFDDAILKRNGRAHQSPEVFQAYQWARQVGFDQINIDLIAGMIGDTDATWNEAVDKALALDPDSVTIYQMEIPHNSLVAGASKEHGTPTPVADWATKRAWVDRAFLRFEQAGYVVSSGYTLVKPSDSSGFVYRDAIWHGADMIGTGVASFSHLGGVHFQNRDRWGDYIDAIHRGELPIARAFPVSDHQRLIREMILQLKLGTIDAGYFRSKFGVEIGDVFRQAWHVLQEEGFAKVEGDAFRLTRPGLLRVDGLLPRFFEPQYRNIRYT